MALVVKCRSCRSKVPKNAEACPACGSAEMRYWIDYWPRGRNGGRRLMAVPETVTSRAQAQELERAFIRANASKRKTPAAAPTKTRVDELFPEYLTWYRLHRAASSWTDVSRSWENTLREIFGEHDVRELRTENITMYQAFRSAQGVTNRTVNKELDYFSGFLSWCRRDKKIAIERILFDELPYNKPLPIILTPEEIDRFFQAAEAEPVYHALFLMMYAAGLRKTSATGIKCGDFDLGGMTVRIRQKGGTYKLLPITDQVVTAVRPIIERLQDPEAYVFSVPRRKKPECNNDNAPVQNVRPALARICKRAKITKWVHPHLLRHSIATHMLASRVNLRTIQSFLGHSQIQTTEIYTHIDLAELRTAQNEVGRYAKTE